MKYITDVLKEKTEKKISDSLEAEIEITDELKIENDCHNFISDNSEYYHELVFQNSSDLMMYINKLGRIIMINEAGLKFSGFKKNEVPSSLVPVRGRPSLPCPPWPFLPCPFRP